MSREKILVVEDDKNISKLVKYNLDKAGFEATVVLTGEEAFKMLNTDSYDLIVLDVMLPKMDGFEVCKKLKSETYLSHIPVILLTARGEEVDRIVGLELGADDYMVKPFSPRELILRIKAILKRRPLAKEKVGEIYQVESLRIDIPRHKVTVNNKEVVLTAMEFKLLLTLVSRGSRVQSRDVLLNDVWELNSEVTTRTIDTHIKRLRQKLGKMGKLIKTIRGHGYSLDQEDES